ncbi:MAG TPA: adenylosuccinate synthase [Thermomicrobiales bacterium]|jgi:adenylosuccinate synthase|nr:adenylosuccinate synthase [Thermomicrobiales bacterium]
MPATIIMGGQWGDEGKGKLTDALAAEADMVVRANGGSNAGHTVVTPRGTFKLHLIPSGILHDRCVSVIGAGVVVEPAALVRELRGLAERDVDLSPLRISNRAHLVMPYHPVLDRLEEDRRGESRIGTTQKGIGPAYADKVNRSGLRIGDLMDEHFLRYRLRLELDRKNALMESGYGAPPMDYDPILDELLEAAEVLRPYVASSETLVQDALADGRDVLIECAQATMLDIDYGSYPFVTSSSPTAAGACQGAGVGPTQVNRVLAVFKAYSTRVGSGPLPTELYDATGDLIRERGREYGTTTGRPRRVGWFDGTAARYAARLNGVTEVALTLVDVLDTLDEIQVSDGYVIDGQKVPAPPALDSQYTRLEATYRSVPGWQQDLTEVQHIDQMPAGALEYVTTIEDLIGAPVTLIGVGPSREQLVERSTGLAAAIGGN